MPHDFCCKLYANVYISWKLFCVWEIISKKGKMHGRFGLCPDFTRVEQYFRNVENAMGNFILFAFGLTLILCIKGVTFRMKKRARNMVSYLKVKYIQSSDNFQYLDPISLYYLVCTMHARVLIILDIFRG